MTDALAPRPWIGVARSEAGAKIAKSRGARVHRDEKSRWIIEWSGGLPTNCCPICRDRFEDHFEETGCRFCECPARGPRKAKADSFEFHGLKASAALEESGGKRRIITIDETEAGHVVSMTWSAKGHAVTVVANGIVINLDLRLFSRMADGGCLDIVDVMKRTGRGFGL